VCGRRDSSSFFFLVALGHGFCGRTLGRWSGSAAAAAVAVVAHPIFGGFRYITTTAPSWHPPLMDPPSFSDAVPTPSLDARFPVPSPPSYTQIQMSAYSIYLLYGSPSLLDSDVMLEFRKYYQIHFALLALTTKFSLCLLCL
jgi:hypothetical protein